MVKYKTRTRSTTRGFIHFFFCFLLKPDNCSLPCWLTFKLHTLCINPVQRPSVTRPARCYYIIIYNITIVRSYYNKLYSPSEFHQSHEIICFLNDIVILVYIIRPAVIHLDVGRYVGTLKNNKPSLDFCYSNYVFSW